VVRRDVLGEPRDGSGVLGIRLGVDPDRIGHGCGRRARTRLLNSS
jgi:hypothetical protein